MVQSSATVASDRSRLRSSIAYRSLASDLIGRTRYDPELAPAPSMRTQSGSRRSPALSHSPGGTGVLTPPTDTDARDLPATPAPLNTENRYLGLAIYRSASTRSDSPSPTLTDCPIHGTAATSSVLATQPLPGHKQPRRSWLGCPRENESRPDRRVLGFRVMHGTWPHPPVALRARRAGLSRRINLFPARLADAAAFAGQSSPATAGGPPTM